MAIHGHNRSGPSCGTLVAEGPASEMNREWRWDATGGARNRALAVPAGGGDEQDSGGHGRAWLSRALCSSSGQAHDISGMTDLLEGLEFGPLIGDRAFDADWLVDEVERRGSMAVIPSRRNRKVPRDHDGEMYKWRHQVENFLAKTGEFRAIATRRDKTDVSYSGAT
ncbi:MAG: hypothetical protein OXC66_09995 [Roseovarius sp.]|nr:hypothetical protein [Roseovarius sp.]